LIVGNFDFGEIVDLNLIVWLANRALFRDHLLGASQHGRMLAAVPHEICWARWARRSGEVYATETLAGKAVVCDPRRPVHRMSEASEELRKWTAVPAIMGQNLEVRQFPESWKSDAFAKAELLANRGRKRWRVVRSVFP